MGISVFVVDAEITFADALVARLDAEDDVEVAVPVNPRAPGLSLIVGRHADLVLLDADLPHNAAARLCEELSSREDAPRVVMLSHGSEATRIAESVCIGATAWVSKDETMEYLLQVIRGVAAGETWLPRAKTGAVLRLLLQEREQQRESERLLAALTPREREVLSYLAEGAGRRAVAERMRVSANTVRTHLQNIMAKLGVHSTLEAVALARPELEASTRRPGER